MLTVLIYMISLLSGCAGNSGNSILKNETINNTENIANEKTDNPAITYMYADWPYYDSLSLLEEAATNIFEGKAVNVFFDIRDSRSGKTVKKAEATEIKYLRLYSVYEIEVEDSFKGTESETVKIGIETGSLAYGVSEQINLLKEVGIYDESKGLSVDANFVPLTLGKTYIFFTCDRGDDYHSVVTINQFAFDNNSKKETNGFNYSEIKNYVKNISDEK